MEKLKMGNLHKNFTQIPNEIILDKSLPDSEFRMYVLLKSYKYGDNGNVFPSQATLARARGKSRESVNKQIQSLRNKGYIDYKRRGYSQSNLYHFICEENFTTNENKSYHHKLQNVHTNKTVSNNTENNKILSEKHLNLIEKIAEWNTRPIFNTTSSKKHVRLLLSYTIKKYGFDAVYKIWDETVNKSSSPHPMYFWNAIKELREGSK
ncbi:MAG: helix-turn-helix domain-containing protein [Microgenomates group bacterium]